MRMLRVTQMMQAYTSGRARVQAVGSKQVRQVAAVNNYCRTALRLINVSLCMLAAAVCSAGCCA